MEVAGVAFRSETSCFLPTGRLRAPRRVHAPDFFLKACALAFLQERAPEDIILNDKLFWGTPFSFHCQNTLNVSRAFLGVFRLPHCWNLKKISFL